MYRSARTIVFALACCASPLIVAAQPEVSANEWSHVTTLNGFAGVAADSSQRGPALGGAMGWELTPGIALECSGSWARFGGDTSSFAGALKMRVRVAGRRHIDPFVQAGVGLYRATFAADATEVPAFYRRRMVAPMTADTSGWTFTDPTMVAGGGVSIYVNRHVALRPDVEVAFVLRDGHSHAVTTVAMHLVYHFESHPVTPARGR